MPKEGRNRGQITGRDGGAAVAAADFALGAGWGGSTITTVRSGSNDRAGHIQITCATGGGLAQATATIVLTFKTAYSAAPVAVIATSFNDNGVTTGMPLAWSCTTTAMTLTYPVLPVNAKLYDITYLISA